MSTTVEIDPQALARLARRQSKRLERARKLLTAGYSASALTEVESARRSLDEFAARLDREKAKG